MPAGLSPELEAGREGPPDERGEAERYAASRPCAAEEIAGPQRRRGRQPRGGPSLVEDACRDDHDPHVREAELYALEHAVRRASTMEDPGGGADDDAVHPGGKREHAGRGWPKRAGEGEGREHERHLGGQSGPEVQARVPGELPRIEPRM